jgi:trimeric autotransporter adhesin
MTRAHYRGVVQDSFGNIQPQSTIAVNQNGVSALLIATLYADDSSADTLSNPYITPDGNISFYLDSPQRVDLVVTAPGQSPLTIPDIDVEEITNSPAQLTFPGSGPSSTQLGNNAVATQQQSVALGDTAAATQQQATATGQNAAASGVQSSAFGQGAAAAGAQATAAGSQATASQAGAIALGFDALADGAGAIAAGQNTGASGTGSVALGNGAAAGNNSSVAIGPGAVTTEDYQIMLGGTGDVVDMPGLVTMLSTPSQIKFRFYVTDTGQIYTRYHYPVDATSLLPGQDQLTSSAGIGSWAAGENVTVASSTANVFGSGTGSMLITQTAAGPAYAAPAAQPVAAGSWYVAKAWYYRASGGGSAIQFQTWLAFYNASSALIGSATAGPAQTIVSGTWIVADVRAQAPSGTASAVIWAGVPSGGASGNTLYAANAGIFLAIPVI